MATDIYESLEVHAKYHSDNDDTNSNIIDGLAQHSPSDDVKNTILLYSTQKDSTTIRKELNKSDINILKATANYLGLPSDYKTANVISNKIVTKLNALMRCICQICQTYYNAGDEAALYCSKCTRPCHDACCQESLNALKPGLTLIYNCYSCTKNNKSDSDVDVDIIQTKEYDQPKPLIQTEDNFTKDLLSQPKTDTIIKVVNAFNLDLLHARYPRSSYPTCEHYKRGNCPHGRRGLDEVDGEQCRNLHPKKCFRWIKAGNHRVHGCNNGPKCEYYHPILCRNSLRYRKCLNPDCSFTHLRFTKRHNENENKDNYPENRQSDNHHHIREPNASEPRQSSITVSQSHLNPRPPTPWYQPNDNALDTQMHSQNQPKENSPNMSFLVELMSSLKKDIKSEIKAINTEMLTFKQSIADHVSLLQPQMKQQMDSIHQELGDVKRNFLSTQQLQQVSQHSGMQTNPNLQHHQLQLLQQHPHVQTHWGIAPS